MTKLSIITIFLVMTVAWDSASFRQPPYAESETGEYPKDAMSLEGILNQIKECEESGRPNNCLQKICKNIKKEKEDYKEYATRRCGSDGYWLDRYNKSDQLGWTDFIKCFPPHMRELMENVSTSPDAFSSKFAVAAWIRGVEIFGLSISSIYLISSLCIFYHHPQLLNNRTRIHRHLFSILLLQDIVTLIIYIDQQTFQLLATYNNLCIIFYILYEMLISLSYAFTLIEGLTLFKMVSSNALQPDFSYQKIKIAGYVIPLLNTIIWITVASYKYGWTQTSRCWFGYNLDTIYWILQGPRLVIITSNVLFMSMVLATLIQKLMNNDKTSEFCKLKITVRAAIILMPLLGITNFISMTNAPLKHSTAGFAVWGFIAYFLRSMQGFFVAYIYCLRNKEVIEVMARKKAFKQSLKDTQSRFRPTNTDCEVDRRDDDESRMEPPECQRDLVGRDLNQPPNDAEIKEEGTTFELTDVIVHRCDDPDSSNH